MDDHYANKLLREAIKNPRCLLEREKFWKRELWPHYLRRCDDILFDDPRAGLVFTLPAPQLAAKIATSDPGVNGADHLLLASSYLAGAYRRNDAYASAEESFKEAQKYRDAASPSALAEHLRRFAYLRLFQKDPACFPMISEAIAIHKRDEHLVDRHQLGECLLCRGHAYYEFNQPGKSYEDLTAALNHISFQIDTKPWYCALHNLADWAIDYGTDEELQAAYDNLKPAQRLLSTSWGHRFGKLKMRWLMALIDARLGALGRAELVMLEVRNGLVQGKHLYEVGMLSIDLAMVYLAQGRHGKIKPLVQETAGIFRGIGMESKAQEALDVWRQAESCTEGILKKVRGIFLSQTRPNPERKAVKYPGLAAQYQSA